MVLLTYGVGSNTGDAATPRGRAFCTASDGRIADAVAGEAGHGELHAHVAIAGGHGLAHLVLQFRQFARAGVRVQRHGGAHLAAQQLVDGHAGALAHDVPERAVDARERVVQRHALRKYDDT